MRAQTRSNHTPLLRASDHRARAFQAAAPGDRLRRGGERFPDATGARGNGICVNPLLASDQQHRQNNYFLKEENKQLQVARARKKLATAGGARAKNKQLQVVRARKMGTFSREPA